MSRTGSSNRSRSDTTAVRAAPGAALRDAGLMRTRPAYRLFGSLSRAFGRQALGELVLDRLQACRVLRGDPLDDGDDLGMALGDVVLLAWILVEVVQQRRVVRDRDLGAARVLRLGDEVGLVGTVPERVELRSSIEVDVLAGAAPGPAQGRAQAVAVEDAVV